MVFVFYCRGYVEIKVIVDFSVKLFIWLYVGYMEGKVVFKFLCCLGNLGNFFLSFEI